MNPFENQQVSRRDVMKGIAALGALPAVAGLALGQGPAARQAD